MPDALHPLRLGGSGNEWFYWRLPPSQQTWLTHTFAWLPYTAHLFSVWYLQFRLQTRKHSEHPAAKKKRFSSTLEFEQKATMAVHVAMLVLHTVLTYL